MMEVKGETHGGRAPADLNDFLDDFMDTTTTTTTTTTKLPNQDADVDSGEASDDLRLDDFIGISEVDSAPKDRGSRPLSSPRRHKKLRKKKQQQASPIIVVEEVKTAEVEQEDEAVEEEVEVEAVTLKDAGNEKGVVDLDECDGKEEMKKTMVGDTDMDFNVLEVVSSHLNLEVSKQKTSLRKKGSLARRKRPTRSTVTLPPGSSDSMFQDTTDGMSRVTFPDESDGADDGDLGTETLPESSSDTAGTQRKFVPRKPPAIIPGLQDLTQSKLFKQERDKRGEEPRQNTGRAFSPGEVSGILDSEPGQASSGVPPESDANASQTRSSDDTDGTRPSPGPKKPPYKPPVWLSEMKAKTTSASGGDADTSGDRPDKDHPAALPTNAGPRAPGGGASPGAARRTRGVSPSAGSLGVKKEEGEKPVWMRKAQEKTSRVADRLQGQKDDQENRQKDGDDVTQATPPWAAELKRKNRPLVATLDSNLTRSSPRQETPPKVNNSADTREREAYTPSWLQRDQTNSSIDSSPRDPGKLKVTNDNAADVRKAQGNPSPTPGLPAWKVELNEKKKRRQSETPSSSSDGTVGTGSKRAGDGISPSSDASSPSPPSMPLWKQQLVQRRRSSNPAVDKAEKPSPGRGGEGGGGGSSSDWLTQVEERRARLLKSGLINQAENESHC